MLPLSKCFLSEELIDFAFPKDYGPLKAGRSIGTTFEDSIVATPGGGPMRKSGFFGDALIGGVIAVLFYVALPAYAGHNWTFQSNGRRWHNHGSIDVWDGPNTGDGFKDRLFCATARADLYSWNFYTDTTFVYHGTNSTNHAAGTFFYSTIDGAGGTLAVTHAWAGVNNADGHTVITTEGNVHVDSAESWYRPAACGGDAPTNTYDIWSLIAHEAGHLEILGDLTSSDSACPNTSSQATMCQPLFAGTERQRTPDTTEDRSSANAAY